MVLWKIMHNCHIAIILFLSVCNLHFRYNRWLVLKYVHSILLLIWCFVCFFFMLFSLYTWNVLDYCLSIIVIVDRSSIKLYFLINDFFVNLSFKKTFFSHTTIVRWSKIAIHPFTMKCWFCLTQADILYHFN